jgi:hypothetical protein
MALIPGGIRLSQHLGEKLLLYHKNAQEEKGSPRDRGTDGNVPSFLSSVVVVQVLHFPLDGSRANQIETF